MSKNKPANSDSTNEKDVAQSTSGGNMTEASYLDDHYFAFEAEYEEMLGMVDIKSGMTVLDAGSGNGSFLSSIARQVGETGQIFALDIAPENVGILQKRIHDGEFACEVEVRQGSIDSLPYADNQFDAVWCANVVQYLDDAGVEATFREFKRVTKLGGVVGVKNTDFHNHHFLPFPTETFWRGLVVNRDFFQNVLRAVNFPAKFRDLGFEKVTYRTVLGQRMQPLRPVERRFLHAWFSYMPTSFLELELEDSDREAWQKLSDGIDSLLAHPDFYCCLADSVTVGRLA